MVEVCRARGLRVDEGDALGFLQCAARRSPRRPARRPGRGAPAARLPPGAHRCGYHKLRPGSRLVLETINPACWFAFFASYIRDITHVRPLHPDTLGYFVQAGGFQRVTIRYRAPYPEHEKLQPIGSADPASQTFNENVEKLNALMFTHLDYAVIGERM